MLNTIIARRALVLVASVPLVTLASCGDAEAIPDSLETRLGSAYDDVSGVLGDKANALGDSAACLADAVRVTWGDERAEDFGVEGGVVDTEQLVAELGDQASDLEALVAGCVEIADTIDAGFRGIGLSDESAECATQVVLNDTKLRTSLVVQLLFGDPGLGTAFVAAARVAGQCLTPDELPLIGEGADPVDLDRVDGEST